MSMQLRLDTLVLVGPSQDAGQGTGLLYQSYSHPSRWLSLQGSPWDIKVKPTGLSLTFILHQHSWVYSRCWDGQREKKKKKKLNEHKLWTLAFGTLRHPRQWNMEEHDVEREWSLASSIVHMASTHIHRQAETQYAAMGFQQIVTSQHWTITEPLRVRGVHVKTKTNNEIKLNVYTWHDHPVCHLPADSRTAHVASLHISLYPYHWQAPVYCSL